MYKNIEEIIERQIKIEELIVGLTNNAPHSSQQTVPASKWMSLKEGAKYADVCNNSFAQFRAMGLKVFEVRGIKRVSRDEIDKFLESNSY